MKNTHLTDSAPFPAIERTASDRNLDAGFQTLRDASRTLETPPHVRAALHQAFARQHQPAPAKTTRTHWSRSWATWVAPGAGIVASTLVAAWVFFLPTAALVTPSHITRAEQPFIALQSLEQIALEPKPQLIRTTMPRMWLASHGVPVNPEVAGENMRAEMLVSASGQPLAMRFVP